MHIIHLNIVTLLIFNQDEVIYKFINWLQLASNRLWIWHPGHRLSDYIATKMYCGDHITMKVMCVITLYMFNYVCLCISIYVLVICQYNY